MTNKLVILAIAIAAIGMVALPETLALFAGQHNWYAVINGGTDPIPVDGKYGVPCMKCHEDVQQQMLAMNSVGAHSNMATTCEECHIVSVLDTTGNVGGGDVAGANIHAATAPECMDCHDGSFTGAPRAYTIKNGTQEAHKDFIASAELNDLMEGANEACVACHTHVAVTITWDKPTDLSFNANSSNIGVWTVSNFQSSGSQINVTTG